LIINTLSLFQLDMPNLIFGEFGMMFRNKFNTNVTYVCHVIYAAVVLAFMF